MNKVKYTTWQKYAKILGLPLITYDEFLKNQDKIQLKIVQVYDRRFFTDRFSFICEKNELDKKIDVFLSDLANKRKQPYDIEWVMTRDGVSRPEAEKIVNALKETTRGTLETFIKRHGPEEGPKRFEEFKNKSMSTIENYKIRYGDEWEDKWDHYCKTRDSSSIEFLTKKYGDPELAKIAKEQIQKKVSYAISLEGYINKYGDDGKRLWDEWCKSKSMPIGYYIEKYGEEDGIRRWKEVSSKKAKANTLEWFIEKYGPEEGPRKKYEASLNRQLTFRGLRNLYGYDVAYEMYHAKDKTQLLNEHRFDNPSSRNLSKSKHSKVSISFFTKLQEGLGRNLNFGRKNELVVFDEVNMATYYYDCYDPHTNTIIEFHGKTFHPREGDINWKNPFGSTYDVVFARDMNRKNYALSNGYGYIVVWDTDIKTKVGEYTMLQKLIKELK